MFCFSPVLSPLFSLSPFGLYNGLVIRYFGIGLIDELLSDIFSWFHFLKEAITEMDQKMCEKEKQLNTLREQRESREKRIKELETCMARLDLLAKNSDTNYAQYDLKVCTRSSLA